MLQVWWMCVGKWFFVGHRELHPQFVTRHDLYDFFSKRSWDHFKKKIMSCCDEEKEFCSTKFLSSPDFCLTPSHVFLNSLLIPKCEGILRFCSCVAKLSLVNHKKEENATTWNNRHDSVVMITMRKKCEKRETSHHHLLSLRLVNESWGWD